MKEPRFVREFRSYVVLKISGSDLDEASKKILVNKAYSSLDFLGRGMITVEESMRILVDVLDYATGRKELEA